MPNFYITAAIDYPNGAPHIGHTLEKVAADVVARYHQLIGDDVRFTMGLDVNSQHIVRAALDNGMSPMQWSEAMEVAFLRAWNALDISVDSWTMTTEPRHYRASTELFERALKNGDIYTATYAGWYCPNCNTYYSDTELIDGRCPNHPTLTPDWLEEENYFFALSKYTDILRQLYAEHPDFITPDVWRPEVMAMLEGGLRDFSVSRKVPAGQEPWGVPIPGDQSQVMYVWFDALTTYLTAIGYPDESAYPRYWPAHSHVIGKDITRFHCLYWPAMLLSAGLPLPKQIVVHGFITLEGQRISKTSGNVIDPVDLVEEFGADPVRYYLMRDVSLASDGDFSRSNLIRRYNDDLGNDLGNLLNRVVAMVGRYREGVVPHMGDGGEFEAELRVTADRARAESERLILAWDLDDALDAIWTLVRRTNQYLEERQPWKLAKDPEQSALLDTVLASSAEATRIAALMLAPYIPNASDRILGQLGLPPIANGDWVTRGGWGTDQFGSVVPAGPLFPRYEVVVAE